LTPFYRRAKIFLYIFKKNLLLNDLSRLPFDLDPILQLLFHRVIW
jgi:hypothetical protein